MIAQDEVLGKGIGVKHLALQGRATPDVAGHAPIGRNSARPFRASGSCGGRCPRAAPWAIAARPCGAPNSESRRKLLAFRFHGAQGTQVAGAT